ncbi:MAG: Ca-activated chloride channel family protein [Bacteroidia bacterium]|jgi:Ca-activated chloride channel family protein
MNTVWFGEYFDDGKSEAPFERLMNLFRELLTYTSGDVAEGLEWLTDLDKEYKLTDDEYSIGDFIAELREKGFIQEGEQSDSFKITAKMEQRIRKGALDEIFGKLKKSKLGNHRSNKTGKGDETQSELRSYLFGDSLDKIDVSESMKQAMIRNASDQFLMNDDDLLVHQTELHTQTSTVLMIDISHSMILYGEDRITPAKKVAMALSEYIKQKYPKDTLNLLVFGNDAWEIQVKDLPYLKVGPFHTNTVAGLKLAQDILRKQKNTNKQIIMITDGKPSCLKEGATYYKNSFGLDRKIVNKTLNEAASCRRQRIAVTTFMIAKDPYLEQFIADFTETANGKAYYSGLNNLGEFVIHDYANNKRKKL